MERGKLTALLLAGAMALAPSLARADDEADVLRLRDIMREGAAASKTMRMTAGWTTVGIGVAEIGAGAVMLAAVNDPTINPTVPIAFIVAGGVTLPVSLTSFLIRTEMEKLADRYARDLEDPTLPASVRVATAIGGLRTAADNEEKARIASLVAGGVLLAACGVGEGFVFALSNFTSAARQGFATAFGVLGALDILLIVEVAVNRPAERALAAWERGRTASAVAVRPVVGPTGFGVLGRF
jgi:hypothetical protein